MERWKDIPGYEGLYQVSDLGRVRRLRRDGSVKRILCLTPMNVTGHLKVSLSKEGVQRNALVHQLVLFAWVGPRPAGLQCCHYDGDTTNNRVSNLRWDTPSSNTLDAVRHGRKLRSGRRVKRSDGAKFISFAEAARHSNCDYYSVSLVCQGRRKSAGGYGWSYCDNPVG